MLWENEAAVKFAWELPKNIRKVILLLEQGIRIQNTDRMHVFRSHFGNIHMCLLFLLVSLLALTPLSPSFLPQRLPFLLPSLKALWQCRLSCSWRELPLLKHSSIFLSFQMVLLLLLEGFHVWGVRWTSPWRGLLWGGQCYFCATSALATPGKTTYERDPWTSLAEMQTKMTGSIRSAARFISQCSSEVSVSNWWSLFSAFWKSPTARDEKTQQEWYFSGYPVYYTPKAFGASTEGLARLTIMCWFVARIILKGMTCHWATWRTSSRPAFGVR